MAHGPTYKVKFRRRREGKTNYYRRRRLLLSRTPRLVIRKTNTATIVQVVKAQVIGDVTLAAADSTELDSHGWTAGTGNLPAAYLSGLLAGRRAKESGVSETILDIGLNPPVRGSRVYAALKGVLDSGLEVPHDPEVLPDDERLSGKHIVAAFKHFQGADSNPSQFSSLGKKKTTITSIPKQFETTKKAILALTKAALKKSKKKPAAKAAAKKKPAKKPAREKPEMKPPRAVPRKPKPKKLIARGRGKKGKRS
ncbi:MAG: 50S ribosomal protein L18 [Candidatus Thorarchaeota archaeon]|jgi:large subunit ribosomal protein L18